ncbi:hypothetical protein DUGA2_46600 [Duganella sp. HH101]|nr:hypothetical protein DUGA2_46600 [Duganella sp. HH101]
MQHDVGGRSEVREFQHVGGVVGIGIDDAVQSVSNRQTIGIRAAFAREHIVSLATNQNVTADPAIQGIVAGAADQYVVAGPARQSIVTVTAIECIGHIAAG